MKIFIDFDDTIFNTARFKTELENIFFRFGITPEEFEATYLNYPQKKETGLRTYSLKNQIEKLEKLKKQSLEKIKNEANFFMKNLSGFVFDDFYSFVQYFPKKDIFLVSFGDSDFQRKKIAASGVEKYFKKIFITDGSKGKIIQQEVGKSPKRKEKVIFIDDRIDQLEEAKKENPKIVLIKMKRPEGRFGKLKGSSLTEKDFFEVADFLEAKKVIEKIKSKAQKPKPVDEKAVRS